MKRRATELLPQVLLTLLSIIQALALELLWTRIFESDYLFQRDVAAVAGWLQFSAITLGIVLIWSTYTNLVLRFVWLPRTRDSIAPFAIGLLEFSLIETTGPDHPALWLFWMAVLFGLATYVSNDIFLHASRERGDASDAFELSGVRSRQMGLTAAAFHLVLGAAVLASGGYGIVAMLCFALVNVLLLVQMRIVHHYYQVALADSERPDDADPVEEASPR